MLSVTERSLTRGLIVLGALAPWPARPALAQAPDFETVVTAPPAPVPDPSAATRTVSGETLSRSTRATTFEAIAQETPGLYANARGPFHGVAMGASGGLRLRGLGGSPNTGVLVLEDGVPAYMGIFGHPIPDTYFPAYLDQVLVLPGGDSVLYGSGAMGAVIDLRTAWPTRSEVRLQGEVGSFDTSAVTAGAVASGARWDAVAAVRALGSSGHRDFAGGQSRSALAKLRLRLLDRLALVLRQRTLLLDAFDPGPASRPFFARTLDVARFNQSLALEHHGDRASGRVVAYANLGRHQLWDGFHSRDDLGGLWVEQHWRAIATDDLRLVLLGGLDARTTGAWARNRLTATAYGRHRDAFADPYAQAQLSHRLGAIVAGGRLHVRPEHDVVPLGKLGLYVPLPRGLGAAARLVQNYRDPTLAERFFPFPVGQSDLRPERATMAEATLSWTGTPGAITLTGYRLRAHDYIRVTGAFPVQRRENIQDVTLLGAEGLAHLRLGGPLSVRAHFGLTERGPYTAQTPARTLAGALSFAQGGFRAELSGFHTGGLFQRDFSQEPIPDPWALDVRVEHDLGRARVWLIVQNLTDHRYAFIADYPMPGLNARAGLELTYD